MIVRKTDYTHQTISRFTTHQKGNLSVEEEATYLRMVAVKEAAKKKLEKRISVISLDKKIIKQATKNLDLLSLNIANKRQVTQKIADELYEISIGIQEEQESVQKNSNRFNETQTQVSNSKSIFQEWGIQVDDLGKDITTGLGDIKNLIEDLRDTRNNIAVYKQEYREKLIADKAAADKAAADKAAADKAAADKAAADKAAADKAAADKAAADKVITSTIFNTIDGEFSYTFLLKYYAKRYNVSAEYVQSRRDVWNFKDGRNTTSIVNRIVNHYDWSPFQELDNWHLCVIPASTPYKTEQRFQSFCIELCESTGLNNGYSLIKCVRERPRVHDGNRNIDILGSMEFNNVRGKKIILFDDVYTQGRSFRKVATKLKTLGATEVYGMFLAKTHWL